MGRRRRVSGAGLRRVAVLVSVVAAALGLAQPADAAVPPHPATAAVTARITGSAAAAKGAAPAPATRVVSSDVVADGWGDAAGYHVQVGSPAGWRQLAVLRPAGLDAASWVGYQCVSGDGRYVAVVTLPAASVNLAAGRDHGGYAYAVAVTSGKVTPLATGVGYKYFSPGCGAGDTAVLTTDIGVEGGPSGRTVLSSVDLATGRVTGSVTVPGQLTSAVPTASGLVAAAGMGPAGDGKVYDHVVEQSQIGRSGFSPEAIHNPANMEPVPSEINQLKANYYSTKQPFSGPGTVRDWLTGQSLAAQHEFGTDILQRLFSGEPLP